MSDQPEITAEKVLARVEPIPTAWAHVDEQGRLVLPVEVTARYGLLPGAKMRLEESENVIRLHRPITHLAKVYVEPTNLCNLGCVTCFRNGWDETLGRMSGATFENILENLKSFSPLPTVFFGGVGEPLFHPMTVEWIARVRQMGARAEMITNGTLLTEKKARQIIKADLDILWVSLDGASPQSYSDIRLGAELPNVLANLKLFRKLRVGSHHPRPQIGIAFVAMQRNIGDLPALLRLGRQVDAKYVSVSNVLPCSEDMQSDVLYRKAIKNITYMPSPWLRYLSLPKIDLDETTIDAFKAALNSGYNVNLAGNNLGGANDVCKFIESGSIAIGWQGDVSPCPPLLHNQVTYLHGKPRLNKRHVVGNINDSPLQALWEDPEYVAYRERVQRFAFAPCTYCGGCEMSEANVDDCFANVHPACGGCLWAQAVIQCP
jgi:MoaA/NifB/PqqE/SkfB family radical SAM enzyme